MFKMEEKLIKDGGGFYIKEALKGLSSEENVLFYNGIVNAIKKITNLDFLKNSREVCSFIDKTKIFHKEDSKDVLSSYFSFFILNYAISGKKIEVGKKNFIHSDIVINATTKQLFNWIKHIELISKEKCSVGPKKLRKLFWCIYESLILEEIISRRVIFSKQKSFVIYIFPSNLDFLKCVDIYITPFEVKVIDETCYLTNMHYSSIRSLFIPNEFSGKVFEFSIQSQSIKNLLNIHIYIDKERLDIIIKTLCEFNNYKRDELEKRYKDLTKFLEKKNLENDSYAAKKIIQEQSLVANLIKLKNISNLEIFNQKIYLPVMFDFRSRKYSLSDISPTFYKEFRFCVFSGYYEKSEKAKHHIFNELIYPNLDKYLFKLQNLKINITNLDLDKKRTIIWLLVSCVEIIKTSIGKKISIELFIEKGVEMLNNEKLEFNDSYDKIKFDYIKFVILDLISNGDKKWLISKDATGSCFQHLIKVAGAKSEESLIWCNLQSLDTWYDPYGYIIDSFKNQKKDIAIDSNIFNFVFSRKFLKKTIMTENYSAGEGCCWDYFSKDIGFYNFTSFEQTEIRKIFSEFYRFIHYDNILIKNSVTEVTQKIIKNDYRVLFNDGGLINLSYFNFDFKEINLFINNKRFTKKERSLTKVLNNKKSLKSLTANFIQSLDASLVRWLLSYEAIISVHDCFLIDYRNITFLISKVNEGMRLQFHKFAIEESTDKIFSIFILI